MKFLEIMNKINFRDLALVNIVFIVLINLLIIYLLTQTTVVFFHEPADYELEFKLLSYIATMLFLLGIVFTIISILKKEPKDFRFKICIWGYPVFILLSIISIFLV